MSREEAVPQSKVNVVVHAVFATRERQPVLPVLLQPRLEAYVTGILQNLSCPPLAVGFVEDHGHLGFVLSSERTIAGVVREVKTGSCLWLKKQGLEDFAWQGGYGAFSVSSSGRDHLVRYIRRQREHHRRSRFSGEYTSLLKRNGMTFDEQDLST